MLNTLRKSVTGPFVKILIGVLILSFAVWGIQDIFGNYKKTVAIEIDDYEISIDDLVIEYNNQISTISSQLNKQISLKESLDLGINEIALENLIRKLVLQIEINKLNMPETTVTRADDGSNTQTRTDTTIPGVSSEIVLKEKAFNEPMDAIVYGVVVSLGFATLENYDYVFRLAEQYKMQPMDLAITRAFTAVPMHALCGVIMGFYFGMYAFVSGGKNLGLALIVPYIFHGTYNFLCYFPPYYIFVVFILLVFSYLLHKNVKNTQKMKRRENEEKVI